MSRRTAVDSRVVTYHDLDRLTKVYYESHTFEQNIFEQNMTGRS